MEKMFETVIGLEVHSQLMTKSKMFCTCRSDYQNSAPNTRVCPVCLGMPGMLPVINKKAVELVIETGLSLNCEIATETKFDRKNYHYPDLMKGYQISQFDLPIALDGYLDIELDGGDNKQVRIERIHLEEDVAKLLHRETFDGEKYSLLDINRAGVPLMEIVTHPDLRSPEEAHKYLTGLHAIIKFIEVSTANMEEGSFRCDANISTRYVGDTNYGPKVEIKNVNSFKSVFQALKFEEIRQRSAISKGEKIVQETRGWSDERGTTISQRSKETSSDYRYFPEPDIPPVYIDEKWITAVKSKMTELPKVKKGKFVDEYGINDYDAELITTTREISELFENTINEIKHINIDLKKSAKSAANWLNVELPRLLKEQNCSLSEIKASPLNLALLIKLIIQGQVSNTMAKSVFDESFLNGENPVDISSRLGLVQINDKESLTSLIEEVLGENPQAIQDYMDGKDTASRYLVGQIMKKSKGTANPKLASELMETALKAQQ